MRIAVITHPADLRIRSSLWGYIRRSPWRYQIDAVILALRRMGHRVFHVSPDQPFRPADAAILHVDMTEMDSAAMALASRYPRCLNAGVRSIAKRSISPNLLAPDTAWTGPVIVKADLNCFGMNELRANRQARKAGLPLPYPGLSRETRHYTVYDNVAAVPAPVWADPWRVVEKFQPERRQGRYALRIWNFLGGYERCNLYSAADPIAKAADIVFHGPCEVPDAIREARLRLGFDYGKFDFAIGPEGPVLYDANRTPGFLVSRPKVMTDAAPAMARAFLAWVADQANGPVAARADES